jgi:taurine dioxygenase
MRFDVAPLPGQDRFGAVVTGLEPAAIDDPQTRQALHDLWIDRGLVVFRGLSGAETQLRLSEIFGEMRGHPLMEKRDQAGRDYRLSDITYDPQTGDMCDIGGGQLRGAWQPWHFDLVYVDKINRGGILRPVQLPAAGGETGFIDQIAAYAALPVELAQKIEGLSVLYRLQIDYSKVRYGHGAERIVRRDPAYAQADEDFRDKPRVIHPMVYAQAETGRKVLNVSPWHADGIEGMENAEGDALLREVAAHATRTELAYFHRWAADDMVLWDNWRMLHCACGVPADMRRHMQRTTIAGDYGMGRVERAPALAG